AIAPQLSEEDRFSLVNDCWSSVQLGRTDGSALLNLMTNLKATGPLSCVVRCGTYLEPSIDLKRRRGELVFGRLPGPFSGRCSMPSVGSPKGANHRIRPSYARI